MEGWTMTWKKYSWIKKAIRGGRLKITEDACCPYCGKENVWARIYDNIGKKRAGLPKQKTGLLACEDHTWVNKSWFEKFRSSDSW
jgi:hypothetical protein